MNNEIITRSFKSPVEIRQANSGKNTICGLIPFNSRSEDMGFYEYIAPTAFNKTLADKSNVRALYNHDASMVLGCVKNDTLRLFADNVGLHIECELPDTSYARDCYNLIKDGYNNGMSFGFNVVQEEWLDEKEEGRDVRILKEVRLLEISFAVAFPAYPATAASARSISLMAKELKEKLADTNETRSVEDMDALADLDTVLRSYLPEEKPVEVHVDTSAVIDTEAVEMKRQLDDFLAELKEI